MQQDYLLQPVWDFLLRHLGQAGVGSGGFLFSAVVAGVYVPGIVFSIVDVFMTKRLTLGECWAVYWRAMKWYSALYVVGMALFLAVPLPPVIHVPAQAPSVGEFCVHMVLYFLLGDFVSYVWHLIEHKHAWYWKRVHSYHHRDRPPLTIWTAMAVHPLQAVTAFVCLNIYGLLFPMHPLTFAVALFSMTAVNMNTHCGYRLPVYDWIFARPMDHHLHHSSRKPKNVSVVLPICDRLFGTYQQYQREAE
jgi:plant 4alpha-monomethylsterol monooxygenase